MVRRLLAAWRGPTAGAPGVFLLGCRLVAGAVFLYASADKILHPRLFADAVAAYAILPDTWVPFVAVTLPWIEAACGIALVAGVLVDAAALATGVMLLVFIGGIASAMARGLEIDCGCFSVSHDAPVGPRRIVEDIILLGACAAVLLDRARHRVAAIRRDLVGSGAFGFAPATPGRRPPS